MISAAARGNFGLRRQPAGETRWLTISLSPTALWCHTPARAALLARGPQSTTILNGVDIRVGRGRRRWHCGRVRVSGKTTLGRALLGLVTPASGTVVFDGTTINTLDERRRQPFRRRMQMIFQDPMSSLNPRHTIGRILIEPILLHGLAKTRSAALDLVYHVLDRVGLSRISVDRYSYELSGGQRQRVGIARAVVLLRPIFALADEIVRGRRLDPGAGAERLIGELSREIRLAARLHQPDDLSVVPSHLPPRGGDARRRRWSKRARATGCFASPEPTKRACSSTRFRCR